ncbi:MAG: hypothetical protein P1Q69_20495 [Candidatus Thorarchaeota archaeon]|nr:hypothetical protein [Candidatus Thorarchaeota archaeon]
MTTTGEFLSQFLKLFEIPSDKKEELYDRSAQLVEIVKDEELSLSDEQCVEIDNQIIKSLEKSFSFDLIQVAMKILVVVNEKRYKSILFEGTSEDFVPMEFYMINLLRQRNMIAFDEFPVFSENATMHFESHLCSRVGAITLTDRQMIVHGAFDYLPVGNNPMIRPFYEEGKGKPILDAIDFFDYHNIENIQLIWNWKKKSIEVKYRTKYIESKERILYGPLFFKAGLPSSAKIKEGALTLEITMRDVPWRGPGKKERAEKFYRKLKELSGS